MGDKLFVPVCFKLSEVNEDTRDLQLKLKGWHLHCRLFRSGHVNQGSTSLKVLSGKGLSQLRRQKARRRFLVSVSDSQTVE